MLVERGLAASWKLALGGTLDVAGLGPQRIVGFTQAPDNVSYPLAAPRVYVSQAALAARVGARADPSVNLAQIWLRDPSYLKEVLVQARATSYGLRGLQFVTRSGVRVLLDQAAGIVIDLLVALSLIALATAGVMLAASARAEIQRRLRAIGVRRAVGAPRGHLALTQALEALLIAAPAGALGALAGTLATYGPSSRLLIMLNEPPAGWSLPAPLLAGWLTSVAIPVLAAAWPAWRAAGRPPVALVSGATGRGVPLVQVLRSILIAIAIVDGLVCLYTLVGACTLTVRERRRTVAVLRAFGAGAPSVRRLLAGAVAALVIPAALLGVAVERLVLGPLMSRIAADYATLPLAAGARQIGVVLAGLALCAAIAVVWVTRQATRETVIAGLTSTRRATPDYWVRRCGRFGARV